MRQKLGDLLVHEGLLTAEQLDKALKKQRSLPGPPKLGEVVLAMGLVSEDRLLNMLSKVLHLPAVDLHDFAPESSVLALVPAVEAKRHLLLPLKVESVGNRKRLLVAIADPTNIQAIDDVQFITGMVVQTAVGTASQIRFALQYYYDRGEAGPLPDEDTPTGKVVATSMKRARDETWVGVNPVAALSTDPRAVAELKFVGGPAQGKLLRLKAGESLVVGRGDQADVYVGDMRMSRKHFLVVDTGTAVELVDMGSRNGVSVNQRSVKRVALTTGDYIQAGDSIIQVALLPRY